MFLKTMIKVSIYPGKIIHLQRLNSNLKETFMFAFQLLSSLVLLGSHPRRTIWCISRYYYASEPSEKLRFLLHPFNGT